MGCGCGGTTTGEVNGGSDVPAGGGGDVPGSWETFLESLSTGDMFWILVLTIFIGALSAKGAKF